MNKIIHATIKLNCTQQQAFEMFTNQTNVQSWLANVAIIEPYVDGKYELFWDENNKEINSTIGCKVTAIEQDKLLCFEWKGPVQFEDIMNTIVPLTHVTVTFIPDCIDSFTEIHLIHTGWGSNDNWEEARLWFENVWKNALNNLKEQIENYGNNE